MINVLISNSAKHLKEALSEFNATATVEAEYGDETVTGSVLTLAHHGKNSGRPCPCSIPALPEMGIEVVGISHLDLDTLGGIMAIEGSKNRHDITCLCNQYDSKFWELAEFKDLNGPHKVDQWYREYEDRQEVIDRINAWNAWSEKNRIPHDEAVSDITKYVDAAIFAIKEILDGDEEYMMAGREWLEAKEHLDSSSHIRTDESGVTLRSSDQFVNHLYRGKCVVALNTKFKSVTVSFADDIEGVSCREAVQELWGAKAGGHDNIAGSPRGQEMTIDDAERLFHKMVSLLKDS